MSWCYRSFIQYILLTGMVAGATYIIVDTWFNPMSYLYIALLMLAVYTIFMYAITVDLEGITVVDGLSKVAIPFVLVQRVRIDKKKLTIEYGYKELRNEYVIKVKNPEAFVLEMQKIAPAIEIERGGGK